MADIRVTLTCADYARVMPLVTGDVKPEGIALTVIHGTGGSWEMRAEMLRRALDDPTVQGGEASIAGHLRRIDKATAAMSGCRSFRCATSPRATSMCAKEDR
jgi:4,5-dihydroxyphthalate decarboxylase